MTRAEIEAFYNTRAWRRVSKAVRRENPWCVICKAEGRGIVKATETDHIEPLSLGGEPLDRDNLRAVCRPCNLRMRRREALGRPKPPNRVTADGFRNPDYDRWRRGRHVAVQSDQVEGAAPHGRV